MKTATALFGLVLIVTPITAIAQVYSGPVTTVDGDTLRMTGERIRLFGIDAPEKAQTCMREGQSWACGAEASAKMDSWVAGKTVECTQQDRDDYGRVVAICTVDGRDLSERLAQVGLAVALPHFTDRYIDAEQIAREHHFGIWSGTFQTPADYRAAHPQDYVRPTPPPVHKSPRTTASSAPMASRPNLYFRSCREARAAGYSMMRRGEPGYRVGLDGDLDGVACEPLPRRR